MTPGTSLWRVFPWDPAARPGAPFSPEFVPDATGRGRFDLPPRLSRAIYLAESPAHALAELIHPWRGRSIDARHLDRAGRRLAVVEVTTAPPGVDVADLCDPAILNRLDVAPDRVASRPRSHTQPIARRVWDSGAAGLRWLSRFWGDWHTTVVFVDRLDEGTRRLSFGDPEVLEVDSPAVEEAAEALGISVRGAPAPG